MIKNIIVFGGSGLIGQEIIKYLEKFNLNILNADLKKSKNINVKFMV
jgi:nucleoside-diphosphate-sugar epimerase